MQLDGRPGGEYHPLNKSKTKKRKSEDSNSNSNGITPLHKSKTKNFQWHPIPS